MFKKVFTGTITLLLFFATSLAIAQTTRFVVWGDSQFQNPEVFEKYVKETALINPDFVCHVGDMIHGYTYNIESARKQWKRFKKQIAPLNCPFYPTCGNHDITTKEIQPAYQEAWGEDKLYYSFSFQNCHFIVMNTFLDQKFYQFPEEEMNWFLQDLEDHKGYENIFITMHAPLYMGDKMDWTEMHNILKKYNVKAVFTGHYHVYDWRNKDGIDYFCVNSSGNMRTFDNHFLGASHHYLEVTVKEGTVNYAVHTKDGILPHNIVSQDERKIAKKYYNSDITFSIPSPNNDNISTTVTVPITNKTDSTRDYILEWETKDFNCSITPAGKKISLNSGETDSVKFDVELPKGEYARADFPYMIIKTPYTTSSGYDTYIKNKVNVFAPPTVNIYKMDSEFELDGKLTEECWNKNCIDTLYIDKNFTPAKEQTKVILSYDNDNIYVGIRGEEPNPEKLSAFAYGDIPLVFGDDDFEIYFDTNLDRVSFYRLMVNPAGTTLSSGPKGLFSFKFDVKTYTGKDYWSAEFKIPFKELDTVVPGINAEWGFNVRRHRQQAEPAQSDWSKMNTRPPYEPEYFGIIKFN